MLKFSKFRFALTAIAIGYLAMPATVFAAGDGAPSVSRQTSAQPLLAPVRLRALGEKSAMAAVVRQQIKAFRDRQMVQAFALAAPRVQVKFGSAENFFGFLSRFYRPIFFPESVFFDGVEETADGPVQRVFLTGPSGRSWQVRFTMTQIDNGEWRIANCKLVLAPGQIA